MAREALSSSMARARKLVHWINSLPLASCLLVDALEELRIGDVLAAIARWLQEKDPDLGVIVSAETGNVRAAVAFAVAFAAQRGSADDGDALFVVNSASCVARVVAGDVEAITAVVSVLRRIAMEKDAAARKQDTEQEQVRRVLVEHALEAHMHDRGGRVELEGSVVELQEASTPADGRKTSERRACRRRLSTVTTVCNSATPTPLPGPICNPSMAHGESIVQKENWRSENRERAGSALTRRSPGRVKKPTKTMATVQDPQVSGVWRWMASLGILPALSDDNNPPLSTSLLQDGVALCALAAFVARRRGSITIRHKLHSIKSPSQPRGSSRSSTGLFPRGATTEPRTKAERRHNLTTAWTLLKECHVLPAPALTLTADELVELVEGHTIADCGLSIWSILAHVQRELHGPLAPRSSLSRRQTDHAVLTSMPTCAVDEEAVRRRPYITTEQIDVVKRWMKAEGVDPMAVASGIFEDCLRNGVALCQILCKTKPRGIARLSFKGSPKTLIEVRANLHNAIAALVSLSEPRIPTVYLTRQAVDAMAMGDKQCIYGLLWHVMQLCKDQDTRKLKTALDSSETTVSRVPPERTVKTATPPPPRSLPIDNTATNTAAVVSPPDIKPRVASLMFDVPASQLVAEELQTDGNLTALVGSCCVPWEASSLLDGIDDIVPTVRATKQASMPVDELHDDIVPWQRAEKLADSNHDLDEEDILPQRVTVVDQIHDSPAETSGLVTSELVEEKRETGTTDAISLSEPAMIISSDTAVPPRAIERAVPHPAPAPTTGYTATQIMQLQRWLQQLGVELANVDAFRDPTAPLHEFSSGVLLCSIVEKLEHLRSMEGVCRDETVARAHALHNIAKALDVLRSNKALPIGLLRRKLQIYEGDRATVLSLLFHLKKAYGHRRRAQHAKGETAAEHHAMHESPV